MNSNKFQTGKVLSVSLAHFVHDVYSSFVAPILPLLVDKLSINYSMAALLGVIQRLPSLINPFIGLLADKINLKILLIIAPSLTTISMSLLGIANSYSMLVLCVLFAGIGSTLFHVPGPVILKTVSGNRVGKGMSFFMFGGEVARTVGPIYILSAISYFGLEGTYKLIPVGVIASIYLYFKLKEIEFKVDNKSKAENSSIAQTLSRAKNTLVNISGILFFRAMLKSALTAFLALYLTNNGYSLWISGIALSTIQFSGALSTLYMGSLSDKLGRKKILLISVLTTPILMFGFLYSNGILTFISLILIGFSIFATGPVILAVVQEIKSERPAFLNGIFMALNFGISSVSLIIIGILSDKFGLNFTYFTATFLSFISIYFTIKLETE